MRQVSAGDEAAKAPSGPRRGLGRGLSALIPQSAHPQPASPESDGRSGGESAGDLRRVALSAVTLNPNQPRKTFGRDELEELTASVREHGVLQPIVVRPLPPEPSRPGPAYELIAGERRLRAATAAGLTEIPALLRDATDGRESLALALIENIQREDLNVIEAAQAYDELLRTHAMTQSDLARVLGKSQPAIANALRLLGLPAPIQDALRSGTITEGHAKAILSVGEEAGMLKLFQEVVGNGLTVRQTEQRAPYFRGRRSEPAAAAVRRGPAPPNAELVEIGRRVSLSMGTRVRLVPGPGERGIIEISYYDHEQLEGLLQRLGSG